ncbi:MAG: hypothetical protein AAB074_10650 [Planctomycetota bacterium]
MRAFQIPAVVTCLMAVAARAETPSDWMKTLKESSEKGQYQFQPEREAALLAPFGSATTEECREAIPALIALINDPKGMPSALHWFMAHEALFAMTWSRIQRAKAPSAGCMSAEDHDMLSEIGEGGGKPGVPPPTWATWWEANKSKDRQEWRRSGIAGLMVDIRAHGKKRWPAIHALEDLGALGKVAWEFVGEKDLDVIRALPLQEDADHMVRSQAATALAGMEDAHADELGEKLALDSSKAWRDRESGIQALEKLGKAGVPALLRVARRLGAIEGVLDPGGDGAIWANAMTSLGRLGGDPKAYVMTIPDKAADRVKAVGLLEDKWGIKPAEPKKE